VNDRTIEHLKLIQGVVNRLGQNSFAYKGWLVTIVAAIFVLAVKENSSLYILIALIPTIAFWGLDAYYLRQEHLFRKLYDGVRKANPDELAQDPFSMDTTPYVGEVAGWWAVCFSKTIFWLYCPVTILIVVAFIITCFLFSPYGCP